MRLTERDELILREVERWRACGSRHIRRLAGFSGQRATDRRLKILIDAQYLERRKYLYGVPSIYFLTAKGKALIQATARPEKVKAEQIIHDMTVIDTAIYFMHSENVRLNQIITEKQLHQQDGFGVRKHRPDFIFKKDDITNCVEVELTLKAKNRLTNIIKDNFMEYDVQNWIIPDTQAKIRQILQDSQNYYTNIRLYSLEEVNDYVSSLL